MQLFTCAEHSDEAAEEEAGDRAANAAVSEGTDAFDPLASPVWRSAAGHADQQHSRAPEIACELEGRAAAKRRAAEDDDSEYMPSQRVACPVRAPPLGAC